MEKQEIQGIKKELQDLKNQVEKLTEKIFPVAKPNYKDWGVENPESLEVCEKCGHPTKTVLNSKTYPCTWYMCTCNFDFSKLFKYASSI